VDAKSAPLDFSTLLSADWQALTSSDAFPFGFVFGPGGQPSDTHSRVSRSQKASPAYGP
jgi:hypothetical protein